MHNVRRDTPAGKVLFQMVHDWWYRRSKEIKSGKVSTAAACTRVANFFFHVSNGSMRCDGCGKHKPLHPLGLCRECFCNTMSEATSQSMH